MWIHAMLYFTHPQMDVDASLRVTADAEDWTLMHPFKVAFSLQL